MFANKYSVRMNLSEMKGVKRGEGGSGVLLWINSGRIDTNLCYLCHSGLIWTINSE